MFFFVVVLILDKCFRNLTDPQLNIDDFFNENYIKDKTRRHPALPELKLGVYDKINLHQCHVKCIRNALPFLLSFAAVHLHASMNLCSSVEHLLTSF